MRLSAVVPATDRPAQVDRVVAAIHAADEPPDDVIVVDDVRIRGPAAARNAGAERAGGDVLVFVDADVLPHGDVFRRIRRAFDRDPNLTALFGSYDDEPEAAGLVSRFRNLLHHYVHQQSGGDAATFWAGLGAVRRDAFVHAGGFDAQRYATASIEDIELGMRLFANGGQIELDPRIQGTHLKHWTLASMLRTDLFGRGIPWVALLARERTTPSNLNLGWRHRLSAAASIVLLASLAARRPRQATLALAAQIALNAGFYRLLRERGGTVQAAAGVALHTLHHLTGVAAVPLGLFDHARRR